MKICIVILLALTLNSCNSQIGNWQKRGITRYGSYSIDSLTIDIYEENNYLKYELKDDKGKVLIENDMNISVYQSWGLFLDNERNLWVFSSDIGDAVWMRNPSTGIYAKKSFDHWLTKDSVPHEVYESDMKRFIK